MVRTKINCKSISLKYKKMSKFFKNNKICSAISDFYHNISDSLILISIVGIKNCFFSSYNYVSEILSIIILHNNIFYNGMLLFWDNSSHFGALNLHNLYGHVPTIKWSSSVLRMIMTLKNWKTLTNNFSYPWWNLVLRLSCGSNKL